MNDEKITTLDMFQLLRKDIKSSETRLLSDIHALEDRLRKVEEAVAGKKAVTTFQRTLMDWLFQLPPRSVSEAR